VAYSSWLYWEKKAHFKLGPGRASARSISDFDRGGCEGIIPL
jgi:hypothetical protein